MKRNILLLNLSDGQKRKGVLKKITKKISITEHCIEEFDFFKVCSQSVYWPVRYMFIPGVCLCVRDCVCVCVKVCASGA